MLSVILFIGIMLMTIPVIIIGIVVLVFFIIKWMRKKDQSAQRTEQQKPYDTQDIEP
ncbi:MAG TPA: hypothetical protein VFQ86_08185 [Arachidicoccus soli]|uniref:hypothetical protein n=1 Tax=Arachidicoccus soli TaxID=2341117 RepID=UPI0013C4001D|nr:hypothetical protein [Arachidicoccus soli]HEU0227701.1 hypothetical protein [Arachidicoccus soli]